MVENLHVYTLHIEPSRAKSDTTVELKRGYVNVVAGSLSEAIKIYLKSISSVDESVISSVAIHIVDVLV